MPFLKIDALPFWKPGQNTGYDTDLFVRFYLAKVWRVVLVVLRKQLMFNQGFGRD